MRKGQAALEFLMTYGWAILVVLAAILALSFTGVINTDKLVPNVCVTNVGLNCVDFTINPSQIQFYFTNNLGSEITVTQVMVGVCNQTFTTQLENSGSSQFVVPCSVGNPGNKFTSEFTVSYIAQSGLTKHTQGELGGVIQ